MRRRGKRDPRGYGRSGRRRGSWYRRSRVMPVEGRALTLGKLRKRQGEVIGDEPGNTSKDPDAAEEAVSEGERGTALPLLPALRQDRPGGHAGPRLCLGESQWRSAWGGRTELLGDRDGRAGGGAGGGAGRTARGRGT